MYKIFGLFTFVAIATITACNTPDSNLTITDTSESKAGLPVETKEANAQYKPAFPGQTRIAGVKTSAPYQVTMLTDKLSMPWGIVTLPDGRFLVTEKEGRIRIVDTTGRIAEPLAGVPEVFYGGQAGLFGITIDPAFTTNRMVYWTFAGNTTQGSLTTVAKGKLSADEKSLENVSIIYRATPAYKGNLHYGGRILFDKTGNLFVSTGERSDLVTRPQAQDLKSALGKLLRITTDGKPAPGNPFLNNPNARPEVYSYGHRNVQNLAFHPQTGDLWEGEFGPRGGDEINLIQAGKNYGWPTITYGIEYNGDKVGESLTQKEGMEQPIYYWDPVVSPSGMTFYNGDDMPEWKNNLFVPGLNSNHIVRLVIENNKVVGEERLLANEKQRFRAIIQGKDDGLYTVTDEGRLYKISKK